MMFLKEDKILIKSLWELKGYGSIHFLREFPTKNWTRWGLDNLLLAKTDLILAPGLVVLIVFFVFLFFTFCMLGF